MDDPNQGPAVQTAESSENSGGADLTIDMTSNAAVGPPAVGARSGILVSNVEPYTVSESYIPDKQRDYVRLIVTVGLLLIFGFVVVWSYVEARSWSNHWAQTKEMLQIILPALTGLIGSVIGFYFGSGVNSTSTSSGTGSTAANKIV
jgi:hypothetical protein